MVFLLSSSIPVPRHNAPSVRVKFALNVNNFNEDPVKLDAYKDAGVVAAVKAYTPLVEALVCHDKKMREKYAAKMQAFLASQQQKFKELDKKFGLEGKTGLHQRYLDEAQSRKYDVEYRSIKNMRPPADAVPTTAENDERDRRFDLLKPADERVLKAIETYFTKNGYSIEKLPTSSWHDGTSPYEKEEKNGDIVIKWDRKKYADYAIRQIKNNIKNEAFEKAKASFCYW